jgi:SM-20-related protein
MHTVTERITNSLSTTGWYVGDSIFSSALTNDLSDQGHALTDSGQLQAAHVGRADGAQLSGRSRSDDTLWLTDAPRNAYEREALATVNTLRTDLNESLYLGARSTELHFARYAPGAFYVKHRDRFRDNDARVVSMVFYLNEAWADDAGGELVIYDGDADGARVACVLPRSGTMVCFLSDRFPHEVLPATQERLSLTGWLSRDQPRFLPQ